MKKYVDKDALQEFTEKLHEKYKRIFALRTQVGGPRVAATAAEMIDPTKVYVYTGSEQGYTEGNWYYHNGTTWASGGVYNAMTVDTDTTLEVEGMAADSKAVGDAILGVETFIAEYNVTTAADIYDAYTAGKTILCRGVISGEEITATLDVFYGDIDGLFAFIFSATASTSDDTMYVYTFGLDEGGWSNAKREVPTASRVAWEGNNKTSLVTQGEKYVWNAAVTDISAIKEELSTETQLSSEQKSSTRESGANAYANLFFTQSFVSGHTYKVVLDFVSADFKGYTCGTVNSTSASGAYVDGGTDTLPWHTTTDYIYSDGDSDTIKFKATGNASYFRFRFSNRTAGVEQKLKLTVYDVTDVINELSNNIDNLSNDMSGLKPEIDPAVISGINTVIGLNANKKLFNLFFMTDTHADAWDATGAFRAANIVDKMQIADAFVHGGDFIAGSYANAGEYSNGLSDIRINEFVNSKLIVTKGNHENYATTEKNSQFVLMFQNNKDAVVDASDPDGGYFYIDYPKSKTRIIVLNTWYDATNSKETLGSHQLAWLYQTALGTLEANYTVLVFAHNIVDNSDDTVDTNVLLPLRQLLHAFANKGNTYGDYTFSANANGELAAVIVGHQHSDNYANTSGFNKVVVTRAGSSDGDGYAVDIFTIDTENHILYETRIGRGSSRSYNYGTTNSQIIT